jgi:tetratricopeptide (TPR) repeat protein
MERLIGIIKILRKGEKRLLRHMYSATTNGEDRLRLELFNLIESGVVKTDDQASKALNRKHSSSAYSHLKTRLRDDILNILLLQESSKRIAQANRAAAFDCRKKLTQAYVLIFRGAYQEGQEVLWSALAIAERFELVAEIVLMNHLLREVVHLIKDVNQLHQVNTDISVNLAKWGDILRSEELSLIMTVPHLFKESSGDEPEINAQLIAELESLYRKNGSARIGLWYYLAFIEYNTSRHNYDVAIEAGKQFVDLVENNPSIRSKNDIAGSNQMLGTAYLNTRNYDNAATHFAKADKYFPIGGNNRIMNFELLFRAQLGMSDHQSALDTINAAIAHPRAKAKPSTLPRWLFFMACTKFLEGQVDNAYRTLIKESYLTKQRDTWNVQYRILEIMILIEQEEEEWIDFRIQTLRKFLSRNRSIGTPRIKAAVDILSALLHSNLNFLTLGKKAELQLHDSFNEAQGFEWNPEGAEIVRVDKWILSKRPLVS